MPEIILFQQMLALEENRGRTLEVEISSLTRKKNEAEEAARRIESEMNRSLQQAKVQWRKVPRGSFAESFAVQPLDGGI